MVHLWRSFSCKARESSPQDQHLFMQGFRLLVSLLSGKAPTNPKNDGYKLKEKYLREFMQIYRRMVYQFLQTYTLKTLCSYQITWATKKKNTLMFQYNTGCLIKGLLTMAYQRFFQWSTWHLGYTTAASQNVCIQSPCDLALHGNIMSTMFHMYPYHPIGRTAYSPTWMVDFYGKLVGKYTVRPMNGMG